MSGKLYLVTRRDLRHGAQAAQLVHGMATFARDYPQTFEEWERTSNTIVCLVVEDEEALRQLHICAEIVSERSELGCVISNFREPDFDDQLTCVVLEPIDVFADLCSGLELACS